MRYSLPQRLALMLCLCGSVFALEMAGSGLWLDVPFVRQAKDGCGAAVIAMVMQYWQNQQSQPAGEASDPAQIQKQLFSSKAHGIYASDLKRYFAEHQFRAFAFAGDWSELRKHLEKGRPLIVALKPSAGETSLHYVVVAGLDWDRNLVLVNDPAQKKLLKEERASFEKEWSATGRWTLLAVPK